MKTIFALLFLISSMGIHAQHHEEDARKTVLSFFISMAAKDTAALASKFSIEATLQTVSPYGTGDFKAMSVSDFLNGISKLKNHKLEERLGVMTIMVDGELAMVWAPYTFYFNDKFSHCGVNLITLIKQDGQWLIHSIVDTRHNDECNVD